MPMTFVIALNAALDLGILLGLFAVMSLPFRIDRSRRVTLAARTAALPERQPPFDVDLAA